MHCDRVGPGRLQTGARAVDVPGPGVAKPGGGQHVQGVGVRARVGDVDRHQHVQRIVLGVVHLDDPVAVVVEGSGVQELILGIELAAAAVLPTQLLVREAALRIVVPPAVPGVAGHAVEVPPVFLDVLPVVRFSPGQPEKAFFEYGVASVPQRQTETEPLLDIAEPGQTVLAPPVRPGTGVIVRQVGPCLAIGAVVLTDGPPLPLAHVRPPEIPVVRLAQPVLKLSEPARPFPLNAHGHPPSGHPTTPGDHRDKPTATPSSGAGEPGGRRHPIAWKG